jgi:hypothetical protein
VLTIPAPPEGGALEYPEAFLPALCTLLPTLASLTAHPMTAAELANLAPLLPHLTALTMRPSAAYVGAARPGLQALTGLRSLALPLHTWGLQAAHEVLRSLSSLPHLQALEWLDGGTALESVSAATHFTSLLFLAHLTSLLIRPVLQDWDQAAVDTLLTGFPHLSALALNVQSPDAYDMELLTGGDTPITALAERTALTSLHVTIGDEEQWDDLQCLSTLQRLGRLSVAATRGPGMSQILDALGSGTVLTSVHLAAHRADSVVSQLPPLPARGVKELGLTHMVLSRSRLMLNMEHLALITKLRLEDVVLLCPTQPMGLAQMSNLQVLDISSDEFSVEGCGNSVASQRQMLKELGGLSRLRDLTLTACERPHLENMGLSDVDLWHIRPLHRTLTRLVLGGIKGSDRLGYILGHGLAVVRRLTCLKELMLRNMAVLERPGLHEHLLPLPASLRRLELESDGVLPEVVDSLQDAARGQDCAVRVGRWV